jgi:hypothetical protein
MWSRLREPNGQFEGRAAAGVCDQLAARWTSGLETKAIACYGQCALMLFGACRAHANFAELAEDICKMVELKKKKESSS